MEGGVNNPGQPIVSQQCVYPLAELDKRELFILSNEGKLQVFNQESMCLEADNSHLQTNRNLISSLTKLLIKPCANIIDQLWLVDSTNQIKSRKDKDFCLTQKKEIELADMKGL